MIRLKDILLEGMRPNEAATIFAKFGVGNAKMLDKGQLKKYYMALVKTHHPDTGGNNEDMQWISAAYDVLKKNAKDVPDVELKPNDDVVSLEFRDPNSEEILDLGQCNHFEFLEIMKKLDPDQISTEPYKNYNNIEDKWLVPTVIIYIHADDFYPLSPELEPLFKH